MKILKTCSFLLLFGFSLAQAQEETIATEKKSFSVGLHYTGNFRNANVVSDSYNGIAGLDAKYLLFSTEVINVQAGLSVDYLNGRDFRKKSSIAYNHAWFFNPNLGIEFNVKNSDFKPFFNLGYTFLNYNYTIYKSNFGSFDPQDYTFNTLEFKVNQSNQTISLQPGARFYFKKAFYLETSYKYFPIEKNFNVHFFNLGLGINL